VPVPRAQVESRAQAAIGIGTLAAQVSTSNFVWAATISQRPPGLQQLPLVLRT
jgi:hypothetical protein